MFSKDVYARRRQTLVAKMADSAAEGKRGIALFIGNTEAPAQYKDNCYKFRQDSTWLYFFGIDQPLYAAIIDLDNGNETVFANDVEIGDIIWMGPQPSVASVAASVGVEKSAPYTDLNAAVAKVLAEGRPVHFVKPSRYYNTMKIASLLGCGTDEVAGRFSLALTKAIISMRLVKEDCEIEAIDDACNLGYEMHTVARNSIVPGIIEQEIVGKMDGVTLSKGWGVSFPTILTQHGETLHNHLHDKIIEPGKLMVIDAGAESNVHYASDFTRTYPTSGKFTAKQREIYQIVCDCNEFAFSMTRPGIGLFMPHGLGHNMGLDVHDMEDYGENYVGYDDDQSRSPQLGLGSLRMARKLVPGNVITDEPGIYFIPALIEKWKSEKTDQGFVNYSKLESYYDFGGIRLEDDVLVTADGARRLGKERLPISPDDVEAAMAK